MAQDLEQLVLSISADTAQMRRALKKLEGDTSASTKKIERQFDGLGKKIGGSFDGIGRAAKGMLAGLVAAFTLREAQQLIDASTRIQNSLKVAGLQGEELTQVYDRLFESAQKNAAPVEALVELYGRAALVQKELGVTSEQLLNFTNNIALALRVSGKSAAESSGALLQLSQALGSGVVRAEEFNSILEGAPTILQAAAAGIKEAGGSVAKLRQLMLDGELSSRALFDGFAAGARTLEEKVAGSTFTVAQQFEKLRTALINAAGQFDRMSGTSEKVGNSLARVESIINSLSNVFEAAADGPMAKYLSVLEKINYYAGLLNPVGLSQEIVGRIGESGALDRLADKLGSSQGPQSVPVTGGKGARVVVDPVQSRIDQAHGLRPEPISLKDPKYQVSGTDDGKGKKSAKERADEYQRLSQRIAETTAEMVAETEAQRQLNPLIDDYGYAAEKARMERELLTAAEEAGKKVTPQLRAEIAALADQYATAGVESAKLADSQDELRQSFEDTRELGKDVVGGFIQDMLNGQTAAEGLKNALGKVADKLIDIGLNDIFGKSGSGGSGIFGSLLSGLFGGGGGSDPWGGMRENGGPVQKGKAYVVGEKRPELFVPGQSGTIIPQVPQMPKVAAPTNQAISIAFAPSITMPNAQPGVGREVEDALKKFEREFTPRVVKSLREIKTRGLA